MKKTIKIILIILILALGILPIYSNAATLNVAMNANISKTKISESDKTVEVTLALGSFSGIAENSTLGYQGTLEYDNNVFESATVTGLNGWTVTYDPTKSTTIVADTATAKANTDIAKITFKLKSNLESGTTGNIQFKNIVLTDGTNETTYNKAFSVTLEKSDAKDNEKNNTTNNETNSQTNTTNTANTQKTNNTTTSGNSTTKSNSTTNTTAITKLPAAGLNNIIILAIGIVIIAAIIFKFKSRKIKY